MAATPVTGGAGGTGGTGGSGGSRRIGRLRRWRRPARRRRRRRHRRQRPAQAAPRPTAAAEATGGNIDIRNGFGTSAGGAGTPGAAGTGGRAAPAGRAVPPDSAAQRRRRMAATVAHRASSGASGSAEAKATPAQAAATEATAGTTQSNSEEIATTAHRSQFERSPVRRSSPVSRSRARPSGWQPPPAPEAATAAPEVRLASIGSPMLSPAPADCPTLLCSSLIGSQASGPDTGAAGRGADRAQRRTIDRVDRAGSD